MTRLWTSGVGIAVACCLTWFAMSSAALAQDATPVGASATCLEVATPAVDAVLEEAHGSGVVPGTPVVESSVDLEALPAGEPADSETVAAVDRVVQTWLACYLSGEALAVLALQSDRMDQDFYGAYGQDPEVLENLLESDLQATPAPIDPQTVISAGRDVRVLVDGRVGGIWSVDGDAAFIVLVDEQGSWVIDDVIDIVDEATPTP